KSLMVLLVEQQQPDSSARPTIRYRRTSSQPVLAAKGTQAAAQTFRSVAPLARPQPTVTTTTATTVATPADSDGAAAPHAQDCAPKNASIHPGASDKPDVGFVDSNCDGIDGTAAKSIFVTPKGVDTNSGTREQPKKTVAAAVAAAAADDLAVLVAAGTY